MAQGLSPATIKRLARQTRQQARAILEEAGQAPGEPLPAAPPDLEAGLAPFIDHTLLKPEASAAQIRQLCAEAREQGFATVCVNSGRVPLAAELLRGSGVKVCSVVGFPLGAGLPGARAHEAQLALAAGAGEIDMVLNVGALKDRDLRALLEDVGAVVAVCHAAGAPCKVILETALLTDEEKIIACVLSQLAGADYVKTSTGFGGGGATVEDIALMRGVVGPVTGVKASGGVRSREDALAMIRAGATRIGASAGVAIVRGERGEGAY